MDWVRWGKEDLVIGFPLGLSLFLSVESSCRHPVKKFDQKNVECHVWKKQANNFNTTSLLTDASKHFMFA